MVNLSVHPPGLPSNLIRSREIIAFHFQKLKATFSLALSLSRSHYRVIGDSSSSAVNGASSSRGDDKNVRSPSPKTLAGTGDNSNSNNNNNNSDGTNASSSTSSTATSVGPITYRQSRFTRTGSLKGDLTSPSRRSAFADSAKESGGSTSRPTASDLPPQPVRLAMPSIYLNPDLTESQATYRAARRRIRESSKLAQRLRRITF